jgi:hypothetical protein
MTKAGLLLGAALALAVTAAGRAEDIDSANYILPACQDFLNRKQPYTGGQGFCAGTIAGISFVGKDLRRLRLDYTSESGAWITWVYCLDIPDKATLNQAVRVVVSYIEARPARMHESFAELALEALRAAWPCK